MKLIQHAILVSLSLVLFAGTAMAQSKTLAKREGLMQPMPMLKATDIQTGLGEAASGDVAVPTRGTEQDVLIGQTIYDLQSNYSSSNRMSKDADGNIMAVWTQGFSSGDGYSDRGTGYNRYDAGTGNWMAPPSDRLENGVRTGWPNHVITDSGTEFIVNHVFTSPEYRLHTLRREAGETNWTESDIPSDTPWGLLWPRAACSGETIHVIGVTTSLVLGGDLYEGVDLHPLYYRSSDGGATWEVQDFIIPGLDSSFMIRNSADAYGIDARGDRVVVGMFFQFGDTKVFISEDGGDTWSETRVHDFPIDKYAIDQGYTVDDLPPYDPNQPDTLAMLTTDNCGHVMMDNDGNVHLFYGQMYVLDDDLTDGNTSYFPGTSGLAYWNESFGPDSVNIIADVLDLNGNDTIDIPDISNIALYYMSLSSMASASVDANNNLYLAYSAVMEGPEFLDADDEQFMRHIFIIKSEDGGANWSEPYDAINGTTIGDPLFVPFVEAVFPHMLRDIDGDVLFTYQQDFQPGLALRGDMDLPGENNIIFSQIGEDLVGQDAIDFVNKYNFELFPNPASDVATVQFELSDAATVRLELFDAMGHQIRIISSAQYAVGQQQEEIDLNGLAGGMYFVRMQIGPKSTVKRLMVD
ncbi:MAG: T9SS type A sorting domain-containing protein [Saprospiraceae bacterium]|nr:T9SS type A sorting domain-containing protein [Saprospiraceae bacterium]